MGEIRLVPGMPVKYFIPTGERTVTYLLKPDQLMRTFRGWLEITELAVLIEQRFPYLAVSDDGPLVSLDDLIRSIQLRDGAANSHDLGYTEQSGHL